MSSENPEIDYPVVVYPDVLTDGSVCYVAEHPDLPGCVAHGDTIDEAKGLLDKARTAYKRHVTETGGEVPQPDPSAPSAMELRSTPAMLGFNADDRTADWLHTTEPV